MNTKGWKTTLSKQVYKSPFMEVTEDEVLDENGRKMLFSLMHLRDGATVLAVDPEHNTYLVRQFRYGYGDYSVEVPGGAIDPGETPEEAGKRELFEELGIKATELISLGSLCSLTSNGRHKEHLFLAKLDHVPEVNPGTEEENIDLINVPFAKALQMAEESKIMLSFSVVAIFRANKYID